MSNISSGQTKIALRDAKERILPPACGAPTPPPLLLALLSDASLLQHGPANTSVKACNGRNLSKICCPSQNSHKEDRIGDDGPVGILALSKQMPLLTVSWDFFERSCGALFSLRLAM